MGKPARNWPGLEPRSFGCAQLPVGCAQLPVGCAQLPSNVFPEPPVAHLVASSWLSEVEASDGSHLLRL